MWKELFKTGKKDDLLIQAWDECYAALDISREIFFQATDLIRNAQPETIVKTIRQKDKLINKFQREIRRKVITHCIVCGPDNLPGGMILVSIIIDIERIGDNAKNILDLAQAHESILLEENWDQELRQLEASVKAQFERIVEILKEHEVAKAREIMIRHKSEIRLTCDRMIDDLVSGRMDNITPADSAALALYLRYLKRISAHIKNIASSVVNPFDRIGYKEKNISK